MPPRSRGNLNLELGAQAWGGVAEFGVALLAVVTSPVNPNAYGVGSASDVEAYVRRRDMVVGGVLSMVAYDPAAAAAGEDGWHRWHEAPVTAMTESMVNITLTVATGGLAGVGRVFVTAGGRVGLRFALAGKVFEFELPASRCLADGLIDIQALTARLGGRALPDGLIAPGPGLQYAGGAIPVVTAHAVVDALDDQLASSTVAATHGMDLEAPTTATTPNGAPVAVHGDQADLPGGIVHEPVEVEAGAGGAASTGAPGRYESESGASVLLGAHEHVPDPVPQRFAPTPYDPAADPFDAWDNAYRNEDGVRVDPRTGVPLVGDAPPASPRQWVMLWDQANGEWVAANRGAGWAGTSRFGEMEFDESLGAAYDSGDAHFPGDHPPGTPPATYVAGSGQSGIQYVNRGSHKAWMDYQASISGWHAQDGVVVEYTHIDPDTGTMVQFDGHTWRGQPPTEVFLEAKDGYAGLAFNPHSPMWEEIADRLIVQAVRQDLNLPPGAVLEWHVSDPNGAAAIAELFVDRGIDEISVIYTPRG